MSYVNNGWKAIKRQGSAYFRPSSYKVNHRMRSANDLLDVASQYTLMVLDRDCAIEPYHAGRIEPCFQNTLETIAYKSEILSNSGFKEFLRIGKIYSDFIPASKLVRMQRKASSITALLRIDKQELSVIDMGSCNQLESYELEHFGSEEFQVFSSRILDEYTKPDPRPLKSVIDYRCFLEQRSPGKTLMFGDRYLTDIMAGNLAGVDTAIVKPYKPWSELPQPLLCFLMRPLDSFVGSLMSRL